MTPDPIRPTPAARSIPLPRVAGIRFPALKPAPEGPDGPDPRVQRLNLNESAFGPSPKALAAAQAALSWAHRYPDHFCADLAREISARTGVATEAMTFGNGSGELLVQCALIALEPGDEAVMPSPTFPTCGKGVQMAGATLVDVPLRADGANDVPAMLAALTPRTRLFYLCTPNNPTGGVLSAGDLALAIAGVPDTCLLVIDEAYHEFAGVEGGPAVLPLLQARKGPWVVTRTFSKAYCLAGLRVGYALTSGPDVALGFTRLRHNFNVTRPSLAAALAALRDEAHVADVIARTVAERQRLAAALSALGAEVLPSFANFVTARFPVPAMPIAEALNAQGIEVQALGWPDSKGSLRITVGTGAQTDMLLAALHAVMEAA